MSDERWMQIDRLLQSALSRPAHEREAFIRDACKDDHAVRDEVLSLLAHEGSAEKFLEPAPAMPAREPLKPGVRLGAYEIRGQIGEGGMGEVYRAHDSRLRRDVALKILPPEAADAERRQRFAREAQAVAALNHPGIVTIHSVEQSEDIHFLTMELVDGRTLGALIPRGGLPIDRLLAVAVPLADAIGAAHSQGIVHRDLKPANVMVTRDGRVKVMDFGLAKLSHRATLLDPDDPTFKTMPLTEDGRIFGTVAYMSPEQAEGRTVDHRTDVFSLGVLLFEMATGRRPFTGDSQVAVLASIVKDTPPSITALKPGLPADFARVVRKCLAKDPARRYQSVLDLRNDLEELAGMTGAPSAMSGTSGAGEEPRRSARSLLSLALGAVVIAAAAGSAVFFWRSGSLGPAGRVVRVQTILPDVSAYADISKDGSKIAYMVKGPDGSTSIVVRRVDEIEARVVAGTKNGLHPLFSPDGQWIAFSDPTRIRKVPVAGGTASTLCDGVLFYGATWGLDDTIVFVDHSRLMKVSAAGGSPTPLTTVDDSNGEVHLRPQYLPDRKHLLFTVKDSKHAAQFAVLDLATGKYQTIGPGGLNGKYLKSGHLAYVRDGTLFVVPFDLETLSMKGGEVRAAENVWFNRDGTADYAVSDDGLLVYFATSSDKMITTLKWIDRSGAMKVLPGQATERWGNGRLSPDGKFVANGIWDSSNNQDLWTYEVTTGRTNRLTFGGENSDPIWSNDSKSILYSAKTPDGRFGIYSVPSDASAKGTLLATTQSSNSVRSMTADRRLVVFAMTLETKLPALYVLPLDANGKAGDPKQLNDGMEIERDGQISPDGQWIAYTSTPINGNFAIDLQRFPVAGARYRISSEGSSALMPRWSRSPNSRELVFWLDGPWRLMATTISDAGLPSEPKELLKMAGEVESTFDVTPDPNKFLIELPPPYWPKARLTIVTNWFQELADLAKPKK